MKTINKKRISPSFLQLVGRLSESSQQGTAENGHPAPFSDAQMQAMAAMISSQVGHAIRSAVEQLQPKLGSSSGSVGPQGPPGRNTIPRKPLFQQRYNFGKAARNWLHVAQYYQGREP